MSFVAKFLGGIVAFYLMFKLYAAIFFIAVHVGQFLNEN